MKRFSCVTIVWVLTAIPAVAEPEKPKFFSVVGAVEIAPINLTRHERIVSQTASSNDGVTRAEVSFATHLQPGTVVVKTSERMLYFIESNQRAISWRVAVGREGFAWKGSNTITRMAQWPDWHPPPEMLQREAANGHLIPDFIKGGPGNPLGARALYLGDSAYRIHGTDKPWTIGQASSSGCIRMMNADVEELYNLTTIGTRVIVE